MVDCGLALWFYDRQMTTDPSGEPPVVLITGATGFLGGYAVQEFISQGFRVLAHGRNPAALQRLELLGAQTIVGDLAGLSQLRRPVDVVVHAAALSSPWGRWPDFELNNVTGTAHVVSFMERNAVPRLVFVSSPSVYADRGDRLAIKESEPIRRRPLNSYIRSKVAAEALLQEAHDLGRVKELVMIRPRGIIGAGDTSVAPRLLSAYRKIGVPLFAGGENLVDLTAVQNVAYALRLAACVQDASGQVYNITNGQPRAFKDLLEILFRELDLPPRYRRANASLFFALGAVLENIFELVPGSPEPPLTRYMVSTIAYSQTLDISRARNQLGYEPQVDIESALAAFATGYRGEHA